MIRLPNPVTGAEDRSFVIEHVPGTTMFLGAMPHDVRSPPRRRTTPTAYFEESAMVDGVATYAEVAMRHLGLS